MPTYHNPGPVPVRRLTFTYEGDQVRLVSEQHVDMILPPSQPPDELERQAGFSVILRDEHGQPVYARAMPDGSYQHREILDAARQNGPYQQPKEAGSEAELGCQCGSYQRACTGDGREMVAKEHPSRRCDIVVAVGELVGRSGTPVVQRQRLGGDEGAVVAVRDRKDAKRAEHNRKCVHGAS